jgi:hypothetical protein
MKAKYIVFGLLVLVLSVITVSLAVKSCRLTEKEKLQIEIQSNEANIQQIQSKRDAANADSVPFSDSTRTNVVESVNSKNGFKLSVRKPKRN